MFVLLNVNKLLPKIIFSVTFFIFLKQKSSIFEEECWNFYAKVEIIVKVLRVI